MGLDMRPMGKPKPGHEKRFAELFQIISSNSIPKSSIWDKLKGKIRPTREELLREWFSIQIPTYETIKAPKVGRDPEAEAWLKSKYDELEKKPTYKSFLEEHKDYYVLELAKETDGLPCYISLGQDENVFRGQFLAECEDLIGGGLVSEAWETKLAPEALDYGLRLMAVAEEIAESNGLTDLSKQNAPPNTGENSLEFKLHIVFSLARWLIFYGKNGHGYEADF